MNRLDRSFTGNSLLESLRRLPIPSRYWLGFSGGADSTALLLALHENAEQLPAPLHVVHFDHGMQQESGAWAAHCQEFCRQRNIPFRLEMLSVPRSSRNSLEEEARNKRYQAIARILGEQEMYLTAHHAEDQAETLFLNLMRGSGIEGLAGIPVLRNLGEGWVARPLLDIHRGELVRFLRERSVDWLEDPSNTDSAFDRNFLRGELFPQLERRWPGLAKRLSRTARNARTSANAMAAVIEQQSGELLKDRMRMPTQGLLALDAEMQSLVLRQWLRRHEIPVLPESRLVEFLQQVSQSQAESQPEVQWGDWMIKRYRGDLCLHRREPFVACEQKAWRESMEVELGPDSGSYHLRGKKTEIPPGWRVGAREAGDRIRTYKSGPSRKLKHFFQTASIPPWLRLGIPVLYWDDEAVALGDWVIGHRLQWWLMENGLELEWKPTDHVLARVRRDCQA